MNRILVVEDEQHLANGLCFNLEAEGYSVEVAETGEEALVKLNATRPPYDIVILDVMLPGRNGFSVVSEMRATGHFVPTLMLTARSRPEDVLQGLSAGADDYLAKPFDLAILIARIRGLLRRREWLKLPPSAREPSIAPDPQAVYTFGVGGDKTVNFDQLQISIGERTFPLTLLEAKLLRFLIQHEGKSVSRATMLSEVWDVKEGTDTRPIDNFIVRLRRYIEDDPTQPRHLLTVRGVGYRFVAAPE